MRSAPSGARVALPSLAICLLCLCAAAPAPLRAAVGSWTALGPEGGFARALAFSAAQQVYAGLDGGGVFRSADGGQSWIAPSGAIAGVTVFSLAADPVTPGIAYAGTNGGVWKTASGGVQWQSFPDHLAGSAVLSVVVDPARPRTVYAETANGVLRSDNGGRRWTAVRAEPPTSGRFSGLVLAAPDQLFFAFEHFDQSANLYLSRDRGATWTVVDGLSGIDQVSGFTMDPISHTLYLAATPAGGQIGLRSLWKSSDGGATWSSSKLPVPLAGNDVHLTVDAAGTLYAGALGVFASTDQGATWTEIGSTVGSGHPFFAFTESLAADPGKSGRLLAGTFGLGIFASTGGAWQAVNSGLTATSIVGLTATSPPHAPSLHVAASSQGVFESGDGGAHWTAQNDGLGLPDAFYPFVDTTSLELDPRHSSVLFAGVFGGIARSADDGAHWSFHAVNSCIDVTILAVSPGAPTLYAGGGSTSASCPLPCFAYISHDAGTTWSCLPGFFEASVAVVDPLSPAVAYVANNQAGLQKTTDDGRHFAHADRGLTPRFVSSLAISPAAHRTIYAATESGVWKSVDAGGHWAKASTAGLPAGQVTALAVDPANARLVYAGVELQGVFRSTDGGTTWTAMNEGFPTLASASLLRLDPATRTLYAGTGGSGAWAITLR